MPAYYLERLLRLLRKQDPALARSLILNVVILANRRDRVRALLEARIEKVRALLLR